MSGRKGLSWFKGSWMDGSAGGGPRDLEAERWRNRMFTMQSGLTPEQFDEGARLQFIKERAPEGDIAPGGSYAPGQFSRPEGLDFDMAGMGEAADNNAILNRQPDMGVSLTGEQRGIKSAYQQMRERYDKAQQADYMRASGYGRSSLRDYTLGEINDLLGRYQNMKTKGLDLSPEEDAQYKALLSEFNTRAKIKPPAAAEEAQAGTGGSWFSNVISRLPFFGGRANAAQGPANVAPGSSFNPNTLNAKDKAAYGWAVKNPNDPRAEKILKKLGAE